MNTSKLLAGAKRYAPSIALGALAAGALIVLPEVASAGSAQGLPWESPLTKIKDSLSGPVALGVSTVGVIMCGLGLVFGGEMNDFVRKIIVLVMVIGLAVAANSFMTTMFAASGAMIAGPAIVHVQHMAQNAGLPGAETIGGILAL